MSLWLDDCILVVRELGWSRIRIPLNITRNQL